MMPSIAASKTGLVTAMLAVALPLAVGTGGPAMGATPILGRNEPAMPDRSPMAKATDPARVVELFRGRTLPPPRDPELAVREEYELARQRGSAEALELFIRRHADHALAAEARKELERMRTEGRR